MRFRPRRANEVSDEPKLQPAEELSEEDSRPPLEPGRFTIRSIRHHHQRPLLGRPNYNDPTFSLTLSSNRARSPVIHKLRHRDPAAHPAG